MSKGNDVPPLAANATSLNLAPKRLLSLFSANLTAPFALAYPPLLMSSLRTLQTMMLIAWPRVPHHRAEILTGLTVCWNRIEEQKSRSKELELLQQSLQTTASILRAVLMRTANAVEEDQAIVDGDQRLRGLYRFNCLCVGLPQAA